jgi:hypothetical protein
VTPARGDLARRTCFTSVTSPPKACLICFTSPPRRRYWQEAISIWWQGAQPRGPCQIIQFRILPSCDSLRLLASHECMRSSRCVQSLQYLGLCINQGDLPCEIFQTFILLPAQESQIPDFSLLFFVHFLSQNFWLQRLTPPLIDAKYVSEDQAHASKSSRAHEHDK